MSELVATTGRAQQLPALRPGVAAATLKRLGLNEPAILRQPAIRRALPLLLGLVLVGALVAGILAMRAPPRAQLFPGLADADKGAILDALTAGGFDARVDSSTGAVEVPADDLYRARMALAQAGLPKAVPGGYDLLSNMPLGASRALERARLKQAQEGELARAIEQIGGVASARVMIALPEPSPFVRDETPPTASVFVSLRSGRALGEAQVRAVQHLVASSIPGLPPERVSVVDGAGALLSAEADEGDLGPSQRQLAYQTKMERQYRDRIAALLGPVLGAGNFSAEVHADLDFTEQQATTERYQPGNSALRSEATSARNDASPPARGIPGAISNTAPPAPTVGSGPPAPAQPGTTPGNAQSTETSTTRNFEVGKEIAVTHQPVGQVRRLAVAVVVRAPAAAAGGSQPDLATLQRLVAAAVGLDAKRGDVVSVVRQPFAAPMIDPGPPAWRGIVDQHAGHLVWLIAVLAAALVTRPLLRRAAPVAPVPTPLALEAPADAAMPGQARIDDAVAGHPADTDLAPDAELEAELARLRPAANAADILSTANSYDDKVAAIRMFVHEDPARATSVFKAMMRNKAEGA